MIQALPHLENTGKQSVYWLFGEYALTHANDFHWAADILRLAAFDFSKKSLLVKLQIMTFGIQIHASKIQEREIIRKLLDYILSLAKFDQNIDIRDRSRFFRKLLELEIIDLIRILAANPILFNNKITIEANLYDFGTMSCFWGTKLNGYHRLPDFKKENTLTFRGKNVTYTF